MSKYLSLCNWHLSGHGEKVALFEGCDYGKSKCDYSSDLRHVYLFDEPEFRHEDDVLINIEDLNMTEADFERFRVQPYPQHMLKDTIIRATKLSYGIVCKFEKESNDKIEREKQFGYCTLNGGLCEGKECEAYDIEEWSNENNCSDHIKWILCQED